MSLTPSPHLTTPRATTPAPWRSWVAARIDRLRASGPEILAFLAVGGVGYVVDVLVFNLLRSTPPLSLWDPAVARVLAAFVAIAVTYHGNRRYTWRGGSRHHRRKEELLFGAFSLIGLLISVGCLLVSHDLLGLRSATADNISANVVGLALGTAFRFWSYRRFVFAD